MIKTLSSLVLAAALMGCASKNPGPVSFEMPYRAPLSSVNVKTIGPDSICPGGAYVYMDIKNFKNLQSNVIDTETYVQQLENLLRSLQNEPQHP